MTLVTATGKHKTHSYTEHSTLLATGAKSQDGTEFYIANLLISFLKALVAAVRASLQENADVVAKVHAGRSASAGFFIGDVMKRGGMWRLSTRLSWSCPQRQNIVVQVIRCLPYHSH